MDEEMVDNVIEKAIQSETRLRAQIEERSESVQEILSREPSFAEKYALLFFLCALILVLAITFIIKYPDTIEVNVKLTATNAPKDVVIRQDGLLVKLLKHNGDPVSKGQVLGWIESIASHTEVITLSVQLDSSLNLLNQGNLNIIAGLFTKKFSHLGEIQQDYQAFITALQQFNDYRVNGFYQHQKDMLQMDIQTLEATNQTILQQKEITEQDLKLSEATYRMNESLFNEKVIAEDAFRTEKSRLLNKQNTIPVLKASILSNEAQRREKLKAVLQIDHDIAEQQMVFQQTVLSFKSTVDNWKKRYLLEAPIAGKIYFIIPLQENQFLQSGKQIGYVSSDDTHYYAEATLPQANFGKIDTGMKVQLRFDAYPYQEVGYLEGSLSYVSKVPSDSGFLANIRLDSGMVTNTHNMLSFRSGLRGRAIIITRDMRLIQRITSGLTQTLTQRK